MNFANRVAIVSGAGGGLGKSYAKFLASKGAKVVVNNRVTSSLKEQKADAVVREIKAEGGEATPNYNDALEGEKIVETALKAYGRVDILINNAGVTNDKTFKNMTWEDWSQVISINMTSHYAITRAVWNVMREQNYGRIINTSSASGLYGLVGQSNYSASKAGIHAFTLSLAKEAKKMNVKINSICPIAFTNMTEGQMDKSISQCFPCELVTPFVGWLCHQDCTDSGKIFEVYGGKVMEVRLQKTKGYKFKMEEINLKNIDENWSKIVDWNDTFYPKDLYKDFVTPIISDIQQEKKQII